MKKTILLIVLCAALTVPSYAQKDDKSELNKLNKEVVSLYKEGKLEEAIKVSDKIVQLAEKSNSVDERTSAIYLATSARLKKEMYQSLVSKLNTQKMKRDEYSKTAKKANKYAIDAEEDFKDAIRMFDAMNSETQQAAFAKSQYAWLLYNHRGKQKRKIVRNPNKLERFEDAEKLYLESLAIYEKTMGNDSDQSLLAAFDIAEFYLTWMRFEKAIPMYERFIGNVEKKYGENQMSLVHALKSLAEIMIATDRESEAKKLIARVSKITGKEVKTPEANLNLGLREKYSAAVGNQENIIRVNPTGNFGSVAQRQGLLRGGEGSATGSQISFTGDSSISIKNSRVLLKVLIDEKGKIIEAEPVSVDMSNKVMEKLVKEAKRKVKGINFEPFVYKGKARKMRGLYLYSSSKIRA